MDNAYAIGKKLLRGNYTAYTPDGVTLFKRAGAWTKTPGIGHIVYFWNSSLGRVAHVGIVETVSQDGFTTIEGNTSSADYDRSGGEVRRKRYSNRDIGGHVYGFGIPSYGNLTCTAKDLLDVAAGEVGYNEKASNRDLDSKTANIGKANWTKYGKWYAESVGSDIYRNAAWCSMFMCWCAWMACKKNQAYRGTGWQQEAEKWYYYIDGVKTAGQWREIGGKWYYFNTDGSMYTGWYKTDDGWYYLDQGNGWMRTSSWIQTDDKWYYVAKSGIMVRSAYAADDKGRGFCWLQDDGSWNGNFNTAPDPVYEIVE